MDKAAPDPLLAIRDRIDAIDEQIHRLLIGRSEVIAELIQVKGTGKPGAAFRPDREAEMMRRLVMRHEGGLPLVTVEHIWREIITTFTAMQAPFGIAAGPADDALALRDAIRFYFGFSIAVTDCPSSEAAIAGAGAGRQIAVVAAEAPGRWWAPLAGAQAPKIFARLPFIDLPGRPAGFPAYVVGPQLRGCAAPDIAVLSLRGSPALAAAIETHGGRIAGRAGDAMLVELPVAATIADVAAEAGEEPPEAAALGGFAQPIRFVADRLA